MEKLVKKFSENDNDTGYVIIDILNFREEVIGRVMKFIKNYYPDLISRYGTLHKTNYCDKEYVKVIRKHANKLIKNML